MKSKMEIKRIHQVINGANQYPIPLDIHFTDQNKKMPIVIFAHGYKGFKDFGAWSIIADQFAEKGFVFVRFNFSHNGTTPDHPLDFVDLNAFGENNYSKELTDFKKVIDHSYHLALANTYWDENDISIIGHSRGGGMAILTAAQHPKVKKLITWAAINSTYRGIPVGDELKEWKEKGLRYVLNGRTKQQMPHFIQFYYDLEKNKEILDIEKHAINLNKPWLIIHGDNDEAVPLSEALKLKEWHPDALLEIVKDGSHTFSISHPWENSELSKTMQEVVDKSISFLSAS
jgi:pimeloyl-ACP methyl ester carboxylesterase